jgi:phage terminase large subunit GpA-like protein
MFDTIEQIVVETAASVRPPERLTVSQAAEKYVQLNNPGGGYVGPWKHDRVPYLIEPMDTLTSHEFTGLAFVGPAQTGKTQMLLNWLTYTALCDPADMMFFEKSQATARDFSISKLARLYRSTKQVGDARLPGRQQQNVYDQQFKAGWIFKLSWPTINEMSGKSIPRLWLTDYDRMPQDVDGEGEPFDLARKRATTYRSFGMTVAESSPGFLIENSNLIMQSPHQAPPADGILKIYNRGDRRRYYWKCVSCKAAFEPDFSRLSYPHSADDMESAEQVVMNCPTCGQIYAHDTDNHHKVPGKYEMNIAARWVRDGMVWQEDGKILGIPFRSDIASYWLKGPAAAFITWKEMVLKFLQATREFENTGSQEGLKTTISQDQGLPYTMKGLGAERLPEELKNRATNNGDKVVPPGVRFLLACIDVQAHSFVVQVHGFGIERDIWVVDRFDIKKSERRDEDDERFWVKPGAYPEDWHLIIEQVIQKTYPLGDGSGRSMQIKFVFCDSGGNEMITHNAYEFYRYLRKQGDNHHRRFLLVKGAPNKDAPRVRLAYPDAERKDRRASARGEVPVLEINSNMIKDQVNQMLNRLDPLGGYISFPDWLPDSFYTELTAETRTAKGWENPKRHRNESWDLLCYAVSGSISQHIAIEYIDWSKPPGWAREWETNDLVSKDATKRFAKEQKTEYTLAQIAEILA